MSRYPPPSGSKVYVGGLDPNVQEQELYDIFARAGSIEKVWIARNPPGFAFVLYNDPRDAEQATRTLDGTEVRGKPVRVEISTKGPRDRSSSTREGGGRDSRDDRGAPRSYEDRGPRGSGGSGGAPCYICHQPGHIAAFCPSNAPPSSRSSGAAPSYPPSSYPPASGGGYPPYPPRGGGGGRRSRSRSPRSRHAGSSGGAAGGTRRDRSRSRSGSRSPRRDYRDGRRSERGPPPADYRRDDRPDERRDVREDRRGNGSGGADRPRRDERPPGDDRDYRGDRKGDLGGGAAPLPPAADDRPEHNDLGDLDAQA